jgi:hypothetical protein
MEDPRREQQSIRRMCEVSRVERELWIQAYERLVPALSKSTEGSGEAVPCQEAVSCVELARGA